MVKTNSKIQAICLYFNQGLIRHLYLLQNIQTGPIPVTGISLTPEILTLGDGQSLQLYGTVLPRNADNTGFNWSSDNPSIVSVDANGQVTAHSIGTANIIVTSDTSLFCYHRLNHSNCMMIILISFNHLCYFIL